MAGKIIFFSIAGPVRDYTGAPTVFFAGFFDILLARMNSKAAMGGAGDLIFFWVPKGAMGSARGGEYYISKPPWSCGKIYAPGDPSLGLKKDILFLEIVNFYIFLREQRSCDGWGARSAPLGV
jgi:hypothetical protein